jgi:hypothetical protein
MIEIDASKVEALAAQGLSMDQIADCVGCARTTLYNRMDEDHGTYDVDIVNAIKRGRSKGIATVANALFQSAKGGNITAQIFYLKNRAPGDWKDRKHNEHTGQDGGPIVIDKIERIVRNGNPSD